MLNLIRKFLKIQKIVDIVVICLWALLFLINSIILIVRLIAGDPVSTWIGDVIRDLIFAGAAVASLIILPKAEEGFEKATNKAEAKNPGILAIVAGALGEIPFGVAAGILMLVMNEEGYAAKNAEAKKDEKVVDAEVIEK